MKFLQRRRFITVYTIILLLILFLLLQSNFHFFFWNRFPKENSNNEKNYFPETSARVKDKVVWHGKILYSDEIKQKGLGELGKPAKLEHVVDADQKQYLWDMNGFDALLSDEISLNRSLKDLRDPRCKDIKYNSILPTVSVVIPFFEEHWTTLLRTVVSVINRSPPSILKEIILVDDGSTIKEFLKAPLDIWLVKNAPIAKVIRLPERTGLINARLTGAEAATGEVLVVLDSHCEVMTGWLPPLLDPIVRDARTVTCPQVEIIEADDFRYIKGTGNRGGFSWDFLYKYLPLTDQDRKEYPSPYPDAVMLGGLFAINLKWFWELGGYDPGIKIWGGEQFEISFKIWQCGGKLLNVPCSSVGHVFRKGGEKRPAAKNAGDFMGHNYKRIAVVWMDEYAEGVYKNIPRIRHLNPGDVSKQLEVRRNLKCKNFSWYLTNIAPEMLETYTGNDPPDLASGTIKNLANPTVCVDNNAKRGDLIPYPCHGYGSQYFALSFEKIMELEGEQQCWIATEMEKPPKISSCIRPPTLPLEWEYDSSSMRIKNRYLSACLELESLTLLKMTPCSDSDYQKWTFKYYQTKDL